MNSIRMALLITLFFYPAFGFATEIVFSGEQNGQFDLFVTENDLTTFKAITDTPANETMPSVSPDGRKVAFISDASGANSIYISEIDGKNRKEAAAGVGAYAHPCWSPEGDRIVVRYAPDPEDLLLNTRIVELDPEKRTQKTLVDSTAFEHDKSSQTIISLDRPLWISRHLLAYVMVEYSDVSVGRISKSTLYIHDLKTDKSIRIAGGESYYDAAGKPLGFKATMPKLMTDKQGGRLIVFTAVRGTMDRSLLRHSLSGKGKGKINLEDEEFFGPFLSDGKMYIYGIMNSDGIPGIVVRRGSLKAKKEVLPFYGRALFPELF